MMAAVMKHVRGKLRGLLLVAAPILMAVAGACSSAGSPSASAPTTAPAQDFVAQPADFTSLRDMTTVRGFFVDNHLGHLDEAVAVANNPDGGVYPVGTIIQLVPQEAMVKRAAGFDPATNDWEFFTLEVSAQGTDHRHPGRRRGDQPLRGQQLRRLPPESRAQVGLRLRAGPWLRAAPDRRRRHRRHTARGPSAG